MQKPPATLEEFLEFQNLNDWPQNPIEDCLTVACTNSTYPLDVINEDLRENTSFNDKAFEELEASICRNASLLDKYASQILNLPYSDDHMLSLNEKVDVPDTSVKATSQEEIKELNSNTRKKKKPSIESSVFPGFKSTEATGLPGQLEPVQVLHHVAENQNLKGATSKSFKKLFLSGASVAVLEDSFWWFFLERFKPCHEEQEQLFNRISDNFVTLFQSAPLDMKDFFFTLYPRCLSQSIYAVFYKAFPESWLVFNEEFKREIVDLIFQWVSGIKPMPCSWEKWDLNWLEETHPLTVKNFKKTSFDIMQTSLLTDERKKLDFNLDDLIQKTREAGVPREVEENVPTVESHCIGPGPEFCHMLFDIGGHSPLVSNYLKMHKLTTYTTGGKRRKLKHTEIRKLPPVGPSYQDVIKEAQKLRKTFRKDIADLEAKTNKELAEIKHQKQRVKWRIEELKNEVSSGITMNSGDLLEKLQKMAFTSNVFKKEGLTIKDLISADNDSE